MEGRTLVETIGRTPLVRLNRVPGAKAGAEILLKMEKMNPGGSLRDRIVRFALEQALQEDRLQLKGRVVAAAGEDGAFSLALICAVRAHPVTIFMAAATRPERRAAVERFGAQVMVVEGSLEEARARAMERAHATHSALLEVESAGIATRAAAEIGRELLEATGETPLDAFVSTVRSGGTLEGVGGVIHARFPDMAVHAVRLTGFTRAEAHGMVDVSREDAFAAAAELARTEGLLVGPASGASFLVARRVAEELGPGKRVVALASDSGERWLDRAA